ncbi:MAG: o-succinylbenzoate synthase [Deltaproteobacteria bacterium]|nr:o-succinylbenzoate synthase [Deltaproteobacteria bacterium]
MKRIRKIDSVELFIVKLPLVKPFETSFSVQTHREALLLKIISDDFFGWGECITSPDPYYCYETNSTSIHIIKKFLITLLMTLENFSIQDALLKFERIRGHYMAKAAVENALLDLMARKCEIPLFELIGGKSKKIMSGISIGIMENMDDLLESIKNACNKKYHRIKIKIKKGKDTELLKTVRRTFPDVRLMADANGDYSYDDSHILKQLDEFHLMMIEQPLCYDDIYHHSLLQQRMDTPICLDESITNLNDAKTAVALGSCKIINIKQGRVGGMIKSKKIQEFCLNNSINVWSGGMLETGIGRAFNIHLQTLPGFVLPGDTSETSRYFTEDIVDKPVVLEPDGFINLPQGTGIGVEVVPKILDRFKVFYERIV